MLISAKRHIAHSRHVNGLRHVSWCAASRLWFILYDASPTSGKQDTVGTDQCFF